MQQIIFTGFVGTTCLKKLEKAGLNKNAGKDL